MTAARDEQARQACRETLITFLTAVDHHVATEALPLFTDDARVVARGELLQGREAIGRFLAGREADTGRKTAHLITNEVFEHVGAERVVLRARVVLLLQQPAGGYHAEQIVETSQTFVPDGPRWRIARRDEAPLHPRPA